MNGAELLVGMLHAYDVRCVFGVPGDTNVAFYAALEALRDGPRHILTRDERSAGYMADAYARITNRPGVVEVPSGGGPMYALPAVAEANESSVPLLLLTFDMPLAGEGRGVISQLFDCARLLEPVTKLSVQIKAAAKIPETIRRAFRVATTGRPGAVQLVIPEDILHQEVRPAEVSMHVEEACRQAPAYAPSASTVDVRRLQSLMTRAARPLIVAGGGVNCSRAGPALTAVAERYRIPVVSTMTGQNAIDDYHELAIGIVGDNGFHPHANRAMEEADLLVYFGCRIGSVVSIGWTFPALRADRQIAQVDICPEFLANNTVNTLSINADARAVLEELSELPMPIDRRNDPGWVPLLNGWRRRFWDQAATDLARQSARRPLSAQLIIDALGRRLTGRHFLLADPGTSTSYLNRFLRLQNRESRVLIPRAFGSLGYALPAVVGAWCADPEARPVGLFGDGSLGMSVGELETLVRLNVPAVLLSFNNSSFGWIKAMHRARRMEPVSVDFTPQDACAIAQAFGLRALRVETPEELESALDAAFAHSGPVFLDLVVESVADVVPPVYRWLRHAGIDPLAVGGQPLVRPDTRPEPPRGE